MRWKLYLKNAALLTVGSMALRVLGMGFRVYIAAWLGGEGMGLYQLILAVYSVFVALASAGVIVRLPVWRRRAWRAGGAWADALGACECGGLIWHGGYAGPGSACRPGGPVYAA